MPIYFGLDRIDGVSVTFPSGSGSLTDTSDATLNSSDQLLEDVSAYSNGTKYVGSIPTRSAGDLVVSGASVSFPAGHYKESQNISVSTASLASPSIDIDVDGLITATVNQLVSGYIEADSTSRSMQLPTQDAKSITPSTSQQIAVGSGNYVIGDIIVDAVPTETKSILANGTYTPSAGKFFSSVTVNIPSESVYLQEKTATPSEVEQSIAPDDGYDGLSLVTISAISSTYVGSGIPTQGDTVITPSNGIQMAIAAGTYTTGDITISAVPSETLDITANGQYTPSSGKWFSSVNVNIAEKIFETQSKSIDPDETEQTVTPDTGYDGLSSVIVKAIPSSYIGSSVTRRGAATITPTESVQTIDADQYLTGIQTISAISSTYVGSAVTRKGAETITPSESIQTIASDQYLTGIQTISAIPSTYVGSAVPRKGAETITPTESIQTIASDQYLTGAQTISAIPSTYVGSSITRKDAATITPSESVQTITSGTYLTGTQTIEAIPSDYIGSSVVFYTYYTGSTDPSSSLGVDGDIYLKTT